MKHYIDGEFTLEQLKDLVDLIESGRVSTFKGTTHTYYYQYCAFNVQCDMNGSCIITRGN